MISYDIANISDKQLNQFLNSTSAHLGRVDDQIVALEDERQTVFKHYLELDVERAKRRRREFHIQDIQLQISCSIDPEGLVVLFEELYS